MTAGNFKGKSVQDWRIGAIGAALTISLGWLLLTPLGDPLTNFSYELPFVFRPDVKLTNVVILYMDDKSHQKLAQRLGQAWDRTIHAQTLSRLTQLGLRQSSSTYSLMKLATPLGTGCWSRQRNDKPTLSLRHRSRPMYRRAPR